jgi:PPOX class probable F420-dependent enzyme
VSPEEARERFAAARVARLATVSADGAPHLVPVAFALLGETVYSVVDDKPKRTLNLRRLENARATGRASLLVDHYEEDWTRLWWVRADGRTRILDPTSRRPGAPSKLYASDTRSNAPWARSSPSTWIAGPAGWEGGGHSASG